MSKIDWQAYLDGSLTGETLQRAEEALANDPTARAELDGLKSFRSVLKSAAMKEVVPELGLLATMKQVVRENRKPWFARPSVLLPVAVAASALVMAVMFASPELSGADRQVLAEASTSTAPRAINSTTDLRQSSFQAAMNGSDPRAAAKWLAEKVNYDAPVIRLASVKGAQLDGAECGYCWIAYRMSYQGQKYVLYGRREQGRDFLTQPLSSSECRSAVQLYRVKDGIAWRGPNDMTYVLTGGDDNGQLALAEAASSETSDLVHI